MSAVSLFLVSAALSCAGAIVSLLLARAEKASKVAGCVFGMAAALFGMAAAVGAIAGPPSFASVQTPLAFADFSLLLNPLSGLLLGVISVLAFAAWLYGLNYFDEYAGHGLGSAGFFMNLFVASMGFVICVDNAFWFLVFFELMSLASYFLVVIEQTEASVRGGFLYIVMAHVGFFLIMVSFFVMSSVTGTFEFQSFRETDFGPVMASVVFVACFFGFGCKAGIVPLHSWLPQAHPAAPSNVSALMSGGMIKIGVFGMVKVGADLLQASGCQLWWGILVLAIGAVSSVLGVVYALAEHDIKRLLAYHSVENIGIILLGVGIGFVGLAQGDVVLSALGFMAGFYHLFNHAMFKGLLFLGAGSVLYSAHTRNMELLGGLARLMPVTAACFLVGSLAISAIPPLNGFVSEWFTYQSMFSAAMTGDVVVRLASALAAVALAITGALAVTCFVKAYGVTFLSSARSDAARAAREVPVPMQLAMVLIAAICVVMGIGAPWVAPVMASIAEFTVHAGGAAVTDGLANVSMGTSSAVSTPLLFVLLVSLVTLVCVLRAALGKGGVAKRRDPWACGYAPDAHMPVVATSFASQVNMFLGPLYEMRATLAAQAGRFTHAFERTVEGAKVAETVGDRYLVDTVAKAVNRISRKVQKVEGGDFRVYIVYIVVALVFFLALAMIVK